MDCGPRGTGTVLLIWMSSTPPGSALWFAIRQIARPRDARDCSVDTVIFFQKAKAFIVTSGLLAGRGTLRFNHNGEMTSGVTLTANGGVMTPPLKIVRLRPYRFSDQGYYCEILNAMV